MTWTPGLIQQARKTALLVTSKPFVARLATDTKGPAGFGHGKLRALGKLNKGVFLFQRKMIG
jgi:hypothetical protein